MLPATGFEFEVVVTITGTTASASKIIEAMPPTDRICPEGRRREWLAQLKEASKLDTTEHDLRRLGEQQIETFATILGIYDAWNLEQARSKPKPILTVVGGYEQPPAT